MASILANFFRWLFCILVKLRAFKFGSVMHLYWGYTQRRNYADMYTILKIVNLKHFHTLHLFPHSQFALRYTLQWIMYVAFILTSSPVFTHIIVINHAY